MNNKVISELNYPAVIVLIATIPRIDALILRALPSIRMQTHQPVQVVIVSDNRVIEAYEQDLLSDCLPNNNIVYLNNQYAAGVAGSTPAGGWL